jgi:HK97 gp10 family phage protein
MGISIQVLGAPELQRKLNGLVPKLEKKIVRKAMREAIRPAAASAAANAPVLSGLLKLSLKVGARKFKNRRKFGVQIATNRLGGASIFYAAFNELGTKHQPARPFMRPALHGNRTQAIEIMKSEIGRGIEAAGRSG